MASRKIKSALISVFHKDGLDEIVKLLDQHDVTIYSTGGTQKFMALNKIRNLLIAVPESNEQYKVGNYFENLDKLISSHQEELEKLKNIKKACLEKMFV
jgi:restriction endonuclease S subunit